nr:PREDICTED: mitochondrial amidoxime-reducing component 1 [Bos mutus]
MRRVAEGSRAPCEGHRAAEVEEAVGGAPTSHPQIPRATPREKDATFRSAGKGFRSRPSFGLSAKDRTSPSSPGRRARSRRAQVGTSLGRLQQVGTVSELWIYPIKSCKGVSVDAAECTALGLRSGHLRDRFWLVINKEGNMVTARQEPRLVLISLTCEGDTLTLSAAYTKDLQLPVKTPTTNVVHRCRVHGLEIEGRDCGEAAAQWITNFLKTQPYRLVHFEPHMQPRNSHQVEDAFSPTDQIPYSDASPFLILSEASLADLNSRLEKKVKIANFRPNIVISGCGVYAEDSWNELLIGDVELKRVMACSRCILTTVDPDTGVMSRKEPLETLKSYRLCDPSERKLYGKSPLFGQYFVLENPGTIHVGDPVYLLGQE